MQRSQSPDRKMRLNPGAAERKEKWGQSEIGWFPHGEREPITGVWGQSP